MPVNRRSVVKNLSALTVFSPYLWQGALAGRSVNLLDFAPANARSAIQNRRYSGDCAPFIQKALDHAVSSGKTLFVPKGLYILLPWLELRQEDNSYRCLAALRLRSGLSIYAEAGAIFKIADGQSTDASPQPMALFATDTVLNSISLTGLTMDMNGAKNPISPDRRHERYARYSQAHIFVSGTPKGTAARVDNFVIQQCVFQNSPGVSCIVMAQSNIKGTDLGSNWKIINNKFIDNGYDTDDHSSIYGWANDVICTDNIFYNKIPYRHIGITGGNTAYEIHGRNHKFYKNKIENYLQGIWVAGNYTSPCINNIIANNIMIISAVGIGFFGETSSQTVIDHTTISENSFTIDDRPLPGIDIKSCVQIASAVAQQNILIKDNSANKIGNVTACCFCMVTRGGIDKKYHNNIEIVSNISTGMTFGNLIKTSPTAQIGNISSKNNIYYDLKISGPFKHFSAADVLDFIYTPQLIHGFSTEGSKIINDCSFKGTVYTLYVNSRVQNLSILLQNPDAPPMFRGPQAEIKKLQGTFAANRPSGLCAQQAGAKVGNNN